MKTLLKNLPVVILCGLVVTIPSVRAQQEVAPERFDGTTAVVQKKKPVSRHHKLMAVRVKRAIKKDARQPVKNNLQAGNGASLPFTVSR